MNANGKYIAKHTSNLHDKYVVVPADKTQNNSAMKRKLKKG
jgi:hypothetical protein